MTTNCTAVTGSSTGYIDSLLVSISGPHKAFVWRDTKELDDPFTAVIHRILRFIADIGLIPHDCLKQPTEIPQAISPLKVASWRAKYEASILSAEDIAALAEPERVARPCHIQSKIMVYKWLTNLHKRGDISRDTLDQFTKLLREDDERGLRAQIMQLCLEKMNEAESHGRNMGYFLWKEVLAGVEFSHGFVDLANLFSQSYHYDKKIEKLEGLSQALTGADEEIALKVKQLETQLKAAMKQDESESPALRYHFFTHVGQINKKLREINGLFNSVFIATCSYGGGHNSAADAVKRYVTATGSHCSIADFSTDVLVETQPIYKIGKLFGQNWNAVDLFNFMLRNQLYWLFNMLFKIDTAVRGFFGVGGSITIEPAKDGSDSEMKRLIRERFLKEMPDQIATVYHMDLNPTIEVAKELGLPILHIATDFDMKMREPFYKGAPNYEHFKVAAPFDHEEVVKTLAPLPSEKVVFLGAPVRPEFLQDADQEKIAAWKQERGLDPDTKVVVIMGGGGGQKVPYAELLANSSSWGQKTHVVVIAGANKQFADELNATFKKEGKLLRGLNPHVTLEVAVDPNPTDQKNPHKLRGQEVAFLLDAADVFVTKPGGMSTMEGLYKGTAMGFDHRVELFDWEEDNVKKVVAAGRGVDNSSLDNFERDIQAAMGLGKDTEFTVFKKLPTNKLLPDFLTKMQQAAALDASVQKRRSLLYTTKLKNGEPL